MAAVSSPHTEHLTTFFKRSAETERLAASRTSAGTTASVLDCCLRFVIWLILLSQNFQPRTTLRRIRSYQSGSVPPEGVGEGRRLCGLRNLDDHRNIQRRHTTRAPLTWRHPRVSSLQIDIRRHRVGANGAVGQPLGLVLCECFHDLPHFIRRKTFCTGCTKFVKILKSSGAGQDGSGVGDLGSGIRDRGGGEYGATHRYARSGAKPTCFRTTRTFA